MPAALLAPVEAPPPPAPLAIPRLWISWEDLWRALLSERSLEALLYVGAFLIIAAAGTFVAFNWGRFSQTWQLLFLVAGTASFFIVGWLLGGRWKLPRSSATFIGIGALIIPVDFFAWTRFRELPPSSYPGIWFTASAFCSAVYAATAWWLRVRFFLIITMVALHSLLLAALKIVGVPVAWWGSVTVAGATAWLILEPRFEEAGDGLGRAAFFTALAASVAGFLAPVVIHSTQWSMLVTTPGPAGPWILSVAAAWGAAAAWGTLAGRRHHPLELAYAASFLMAGAAALTLLALVPRPWVSAGLLVLAGIYVAGADRLKREDPRGMVLRRAARETGVGLSVLALVWSLIDSASAGAVFTSAAVLYAWWAHRFRAPRILVGAQAALLVGITAALLFFDAPPRFWPVGVLAAAAAGVVAAAASRAAPVFARELYLGASVEIALALIAAPLVGAFPDVQTVVVAGALALSLYSAVLAHRGSDPALADLTDALFPGRPRGPVFQWSTAVLGAAVLVLGWLWWRPIPHGLPAAALVLATLFILIARRLGRIADQYAAPWMTAGSAVAVLAPLLAIGLGNRGEIVLTLLLAAATSALWAWLLDTPALAHLAAWLVIPPFVLELPEALARGWVPSREAYAWAFATLAVVYLLIGTVLDRLARRFSAGFHLLGHLLMPFALLWALQEEVVERWTLAVAVLFYAFSARLVHANRHPSFESLVRRLTARVGEAARGTLRAAFVYAAAWLFPFWYHLTLHHVPGIGHAHARFGIAAALLGWAYLGGGQVVGRLDLHYRLPLQIAAQTLVVVGALLAAADRFLLIISMALGVGLQLMFVRLTGHVLWTYVAALGGAGLAGLLLAHLEVPAAPAGWLMILLAGAYLALAETSFRRNRATAMGASVPTAAAALFAVAFLVTVVGILLAALQGPRDAAVAFLLGAAVFLWAGLRLNQPLLGYAVAGLLSAAYVAGLVVLFRARGIPQPHYGIWLAPAIAAFFAVGRMLERRGARGRGVDRISASGRLLLGASWAGPAYVTAHVGTATMMVHSAPDPIIFPVVLALGAAVYAISAVTFRSLLWVYPAVVASHLALFFALLRLPVDPRLIPAAFVPVTALLAVIGRRVERPRGGAPLRDLVWAQPWYLIALVDVALWELVGVIDPRTGLLTSIGFAAVSAPFASLWGDPRPAVASLILLTAGFGEALRWLRLPYDAALLSISLYALLLGAVSVGLRQARRGDLWRATARLLAIVLSAAALGVAVVGVPSAVPKAGEALVYTLSIVGLLYLLLALADRRERLGYPGVAMLEGAWAIFLLKRLMVSELQVYVIPAALYLLGVAAVERRQGRRSLARAVDTAGLLLLFGSSLWQSLGPAGFPYAVLAAVEALLVAWNGAVARGRRRFFTGFGVLVLNVLIQAVDPLRALNKTVLFLSLGVILVAAAVLAERNRERIIRTTREWRAQLEAWD